MRITLLSLNISWENKQENFYKIENLINSNSNIGNLIILPEMFSTGFSMNTQLAETQEGETLLWMKRIAKKYNVALIGSFPYKEDNKFYNRAFFVYPLGEVAFYDKHHLFRMGDEHKFYSKGIGMPIFKYKDVNIGLNICYDIRFPVWSRNINLKYDVLINIANFPKQRIKVIEPLIKARAIENQSYVLFVNRDGKDFNMEYCKSSMMVDFKGNTFGEEFNIDDGCGNSTQVINGNIDINELKNFREAFPVWLDSDKFCLE